MKLKDIEYNILRKQREKINALKKQNEQLQEEKDTFAEALKNSFDRTQQLEREKKELIILLKAIKNQITDHMSYNECEDVLNYCERNILQLLSKIKE